MSTASVDRDWGELRAQVRAMLGSRLANAADADDVVQEVLLRVFRGAGSVRDDQRFGAWLATMVRNAATDRLRARQRHPIAPPRAGEELEVPTAEDGDDEARGPALLAIALRPFAARLPAIYRDVIVLSELEGVPHAEIARRLSISVSGVKSRVQRGRELLRKLLTDCCEIALDARGAVVDCVPKGEAPGADCCPPDDAPVPLRPRPT